MVKATPPQVLAFKAFEGLSALAKNPAVREAAGQVKAFISSHARPLMQDAHKAMGQFADNIKAMPHHTPPASSTGPADLGDAKTEGEGAKQAKPDAMKMFSSLKKLMTSATKRQEARQALKTKGLELLDSDAASEMHGHFQSALQAILPHAQAARPALGNLLNQARNMASQMSGSGGMRRGLPRGCVVEPPTQPQPAGA
jgi:hypothetical protein